MDYSTRGKDNAVDGYAFLDERHSGLRMKNYFITIEYG